MAKSAIDYLNLLKSLLPKGRAWTRESGSYLEQLLYGKAEEFSRIEGRSDDLLIERDTRTTTELLTDHETDFGLPETGRSLAGTIAKRREELNAKLIAVGQQDKGYFESIAEALGYDITIEEYTVFRSGIGAAGDPCGVATNLFWWTIYVSSNGDKGNFGIEFPALEFDGIYPNDRNYISELIRSLDQIIFEINKLKPAHTIALYDFRDDAFDRAFDWGFDSFPHNDGTIVPGSFRFEFGDAFANNYSYDGKYLIGSFDSAFTLAYDAHNGGCFDRGFYTGFHIEG